jgi:hypothetical protein
MSPQTMYGGIQERYDIHILVGKRWGMVKSFRRANDDDAPKGVAYRRSGRFANLLHLISRRPVQVTQYVTTQAWRTWPQEAGAHVDG